jgi:Cu(I)/Ag(I) efflux system membrane protein CusA/SilA
MLATGIKSPVGIKVTGPDLATLDRLGAQIAQQVKTVPGTSSAIADRILGGRYIDIQVDRLAAARYGLSIEDIQNTAAVAVGGMSVGEKLEGLARFPINIRFPREQRDSVGALQSLPIVTASGGIVPLGAVARIEIVSGPVMVKSENARPSAWVYVDVRDRDIVGFVKEAREKVASTVTMPPGYSLVWSGQFEYAERASQRLKWIVPATIGVIFLLLFMAFGRAREALIVLLTLPFALVGGIWLVYLLGHAFSIATAVGFIALAGLAAEFGVIMLVYLDKAIEERLIAGRMDKDEDLEDALMEGAVLRVRPKAMTVAVILAGLFPLLVGTGTGSEVMQRLAAPMVGGMITAPILSLFVLPAIYKLLGVKRFRKPEPEEEEEALPLVARPEPA